MRVIDQLIQHFCDRGTLSTKDLDYLNTRGFFSNDEAYRTFRQEAATREQHLIVAEDPLLDQAETLEKQTGSRKRKGGKPRQKPFDVPALTSALQEHFANRIPYAALDDLGQCAGAESGWQAAAAMLADCSDGAFQTALESLLEKRPDALAELWHWVDVEPLYAIVDHPGAHGRVARDFRLLLQIAAGAAERTSLSLLREVEVNAVRRLLLIRRKLLSACALLRGQPRRLARCLATRGQPEWESWKSFCWALVVVFNAQHPCDDPNGDVLKSQPAGYPLPANGRTLSWSTVTNGWSLAWRISPDEVRRLFALVFESSEAGNEPVADPFVPGTSNSSRRSRSKELHETGYQFLCPFAWKIPCLSEGSADS